ncbi:MAG TPA: DUF6600 domain-containing protein [Alphaproteobacteria bacterium]|nr:DUF6600 domain-containing protein [Alphaproteobacteria bacterium]
MLASFSANAQTLQPGTQVIFQNSPQTQNQPVQQYQVPNTNPELGPLSPTPPGQNVVSNGPDPQARVGRISVIDGSVSFHTPDQNAWSYATLNYPVVSGESFWTEPNAKAEIQVGSSAIRMDGGTEMDINELDDHGLRVEVTQGMVNVHVSTVNPGEVNQIITPHETINLLQPGTYHVHPGSGDAPDEIAVLKGNIQISDEQSMLNIGPGETALIRPGNPPDIQVHESEATPFDNWSLGRDNYEEPRQVTQYVSPEMTGYEDLGSYGTWQADPTYGNIWTPTEVPVGWQPYHYGHWVWVSPWGWTWVDDAPWGFAPFHYGRWAYMREHWCWIPGTIAPRPVYAPALVAFIGGSGLSLTIGFGGAPVGWFPLGPHEIYHPGYHYGYDYFRRVNVANVHNVTINNFNTRQNVNANFANRRFATVVSQNDFASSHPVNKAAINVPAAKLANAPVNAVSSPNVEGLRHQATPQRIAPTPPHQPTSPQVQAHPVGTNAIVNGAVNRSVPEHNEPARFANTPQTPNAAPGPPIQHRDWSNFHPSMHSAATPQIPQAAQATHEAVPQAAPRTAVEQRAAAQQSAVQEKVQAQTQQRFVPTQQHMQQRQIQQQQHVQRQEIQVQHPTQSVPLTPSHQGWVRQAPQQHNQAPQPHAEQHNEQHSAPQQGRQDQR